MSKASNKAKLEEFFAKLILCYNAKAMKYIPWILLLSLFLFSYTAEDVALRAEKKLLSLNSLKANFIQIYYSKSLFTPLREKGKLYFKKTGLMKWIYKEPEEKIFLYKKGKYEFYDIENNQLHRGFLSEENHESEILELLSGKMQIQDNYHIGFSQLPSDTARVFQLKLIPREEDEYSSILLEIEKKTWLIRKAIFFDWAGNKTEFHFSQIKTNVPLPQNIFELKIPQDVEIIESDLIQKK